MYEYKEEESEHTLWMGLIIDYEERERERGGKKKSVRKSSVTMYKLTDMKSKGLLTLKAKANLPELKLK